MEASCIKEKVFKFKYGPHFSSLKQTDFLPFSCAIGADYSISDIMSNSTGFCQVTES